MDLPALRAQSLRQAGAASLQGRLSEEFSPRGAYPRDVYGVGINRATTKRFGNLSERIMSPIPDEAAEMHEAARLRRELDQLAKEVFALVEEDQGRGFVSQSSGSNFESKAQFFAVVRGWEAHTRTAANKLRAFLVKHAEY